MNISTCARGTRRGSGNIPIDSNELSTSSVLRLKKPQPSFEGEREREDFTAGIPAVSVGAAQVIHSMNWARIMELSVCHCCLSLSPAALSSSVLQLE